MFLALIGSGCNKKQEWEFRSFEPPTPLIPDFLLNSSINRNDLIGTWSYVNSNCVNQYNYLHCAYCLGNMENSERILQVDSNFFRCYGYPIERYYEREFKVDSNKLSFTIDSLDPQEQYLRTAIFPEYNEKYMYLINDSLYLIQFEGSQISYDKFVRRTIENDSLIQLDERIFDWRTLQTKWHFPPDITPPVPLECDKSKFLPDTLNLTPENASNYYFKNQELHIVNDGDTTHFEFFCYRGRTLYINYLCNGEYYLIHYCRD